MVIRQASKKAINRCLKGALSKVCLLGIIVITSACDSGGNSNPPGLTGTDDDNAATTGTLPHIHVVFYWENFLTGENQARKAYHVNLKACRDANYPVRELSAADEAKLDTRRIEIKISPHEQFVRETSWTLTRDGDPDDARSLCLNRLEEDDHKIPVEDPDFFVPFDGDAGAHIHASSGWTETGKSTVHGQPCRRWKNSRPESLQEVCLWSGGKEWGFSDGPLDMAGCAVIPPNEYLNTIPLEGGSLNKNGCVITLESFSFRR